MCRAIYYSMLPDERDSDAMLAQFVGISRRLGLEFDNPGRALLAFAAELTGSEYEWLNRLTRLDARNLGLLLAQTTARRPTIDAGGARAAA